MDAADFLHAWAKICNEAKCCINCNIYGYCQGGLCGIPREMFGEYEPNYQHIEIEELVEAVNELCKKV